MNPQLQTQNGQRLQRNVYTLLFSFIFLSLFPTIAEVISRGMGRGGGEDVQLINLLLTIGLKIILTSSQTLWGYKKDLGRKIEIEIYQKAIFNKLTISP